MKAVLMAGGEGSRLRPLTLTRPKPMLPLVNRPLLGHLLNLLKRHGIVDVVITLRYMAGRIEDYVGDGSAFGLNVEYVLEEMPLGTAGSVRNAAFCLPHDQPFLVVSGDALTDFDLGAILANHRQQGALATLALHHVPDPLDYGVINVDGSGRITQFMEKPGWRDVTSDLVNTGIYVLEPEVLERLPAGQPLDWSHDVFPGLLEAGAPLYGYVPGGYWTDVGTLAEYLRGSADLLSARLHLGDLGDRIGADIWTGGAVEVAEDAQLFGPIYLGHEVKIRGGVQIHGPAVIGDYTIVDSQARIDRSIVWRNCYVGEGAELHGAVVGQQCSLKARSALFEGTVVGDSSVIGEDAVLRPGVKLWPGKEVEVGATVNRSIIWGSQGRRVLFGRYGVTGVVNVDLTPDFVARLGSAFGSVLPKGSAVTINRDPHRSPRMLKRALISGLPSAGNNVLDLHTVPIPVARYYTRAVGAAGGLHIRLSPYDQRVVDIRFFDRTGLNLTRGQERAIERVFFQEDNRRAFMEDIGSIEEAPDAVEVYARGYLDAINLGAVREAHFKIVVDYANGPAAVVLPDLLERLGVETVPLNARIDPSKTSVAQAEFLAERAQLATITGALADAVFGVRVDMGGEKIFVADDTGATVPDPVMCAAIVSLALQAHAGGVVVVTADQSQVFELLAERYGGRVQRCQVDAQAMMQAASGEGVLMAGDGTGSFVFPALHPAIDGLVALGKLLELLAVRRTRLSQVLSDLPAFYVACAQIEGTWESKGRVMRCLAEHFSSMETDTLDGIKVRLDDRSWVLIRPDADRAAFHVAAEAASGAGAEQIVAEYGRLLRSLVQTGAPAP